MADEFIAALEVGWARTKLSFRIATHAAVHSSHLSNGTRDFAKQIAVNCLTEISGARAQNEKLAASLERRVSKLLSKL